NSRSRLPVDYNGDIYTCGAKGYRIEVFNGRGAFDCPVGMALRCDMLSSVPGVSFDEVVDRGYDPLSGRRCVKGCLCLSTWLPT
ncbi:hypothetical protein GW17_00047912, partial [Ensete ventricosum]